MLCWCMVFSPVIVTLMTALSGLNQIERARRSGIAGSPPSLIEHGTREPPVATLETLLRATRHTVVAIHTVRSDAAHIAAEIRDLLVADKKLARRPVGDKPAGDANGAFRRFLQLADNLAAEDGAARVGLTLTEPVPEWIRTRSGDPNDPWAPPASDYDIPVDQAQVPHAFLSRGILIEAATLESV